MLSKMLAKKFKAKFNQCRKKSVLKIIRFEK